MSCLNKLIINEYYASRTRWTVSPLPSIFLPYVYYIGTRITITHYRNKNVAQSSLLKFIFKKEKKG